MSMCKIQDGDVVVFVEGTDLYCGDGTNARTGREERYTVRAHDHSDVCVSLQAAVFIGDRDRVVRVCRNDVQIYPPPEKSVRERLIELVTEGRWLTPQGFVDLLLEYFDIKAKGKP